VEELPKKGSYFTKEIHVAKTSLIIVRGTDDKVRAFHNICRHRGNKLVWQDYPQEETSGTTRQFTCKYHAWRYGLDGACSFVQQEQEFFDLNKEDYGLVPHHCDVWEGFIFINLASEPEQSLRDFLGPMVTALDGYPFGEMTTRFKFVSPVKANWKLYMDAFQEFYHAPVLHAKQAPTSFSALAQQAGFEAPYYKLEGPHRVISTSGIRHWELDDDKVKGIDKHLQAGLFGMWNKPEIGPLPEGLNPGKCDPWGLDSFQLFPNFVILVWAQNWYLTYNYWPTSYNSHIFEGNLYFVPPKTPRERVQLELVVAATKEFALQDANTLEATQSMLESRVVDRFPLNDQEILCRHLHKVAQDWVEDYKKASI
jgi:Rieske 2Fe-2S family protein